jgi:uncharacterized protein YggT (Ycf19 family)
MSRNSTTIIVSEISPSPPPDRRDYYVRRGLQIVDLCFYLIYVVVLLQIMLEGLGARDWSGFKRFLDQISGPVLRPFRGLLEDPRVENYQVMASYIAAMIVYLILQALIHRVVRVLANSPAREA